MERNWLVQPLLFGVLLYVLRCGADIHMWELMYQDGNFFLSQVDGWIRSWGDGSNGLEEFCLNVFPRS